MKPGVEAGYVMRQSTNRLLTLLPETALGAVAGWIVVAICWKLIAPNIDWPKWLFVVAPFSGAIIGAVLCALRISRTFPADAIAVLRAKALRASAALILIGPAVGFATGYLSLPRGGARYFHWTAFALCGFAAAAILAIALSVVAILLKWIGKGKVPGEESKVTDDKTPQISSPINET
jgi:hypothetical protein